MFFLTTSPSLEITALVSQGNTVTRPTSTRRRSSIAGSEKPSDLYPFGAETSLAVNLDISFRVVKVLYAFS